MKERIHTRWRTCCRREAYKTGGDPVRVSTGPELCPEGPRWSVAPATDRYGVILWESRERKGLSDSWQKLASTGKGRNLKTVEEEKEEGTMLVWPLTIYWEHGDRKRDDLAAETEEAAEALAEHIYRTWDGVLAVHVEEPVEDTAEIYEIVAAPDGMGRSAGPSSSGEGMGRTEGRKDKVQIDIDSSDYQKARRAAKNAGETLDAWMSQAIAERAQRQQDKPQETGRESRRGYLSGGWFDKISSVAGDD